jgi:hypothetical protein
MSRHRAALLHLGISACVILGCLAALLSVWYPPPYFQAMGARGLAFIMLAVDVTLGPFITWVVFSPTKPLHLIRLDLAVIALLQLSALAYGIHVIAEARPAYLLFVRDRFEIAAADEVQQAALAQAAPAFRSIPWTGPRLAAAVIPTDLDERTKVMMSSLGGVDLKTFPQYYVAYETQLDAVKAKAQPLAVLRKRHPEAAKVLAAAIADTGVPEARLEFLPLRGRKKDLSVLLDSVTGKIAGFANIDPWVS